MKILPVNVSFKSNLPADNYNEMFLYRQKHPDKEKFIKRYSIATAILAASAVTVALLNIGRKKRFPDSIIEIADKTKGLNRIEDQERLINLIKSKFIYPIKSSQLGDNNIAKSKYYKSGIVLTGKDSKELVNITNALSEHFKALEINTVPLKTVIERKKDGEKYQRRLRKNELEKQLYKIFKTAKEKYNKYGEYTFINLGNIDAVTNLKIVKSTDSNVDKLLSDITSHDAPGIVWGGWTTQGTSLPLKFSELPVIVAKLK